MKKMFLALAVLLVLAGCQLFTSNHFVGSWIGHGEKSQADYPSAGHTTLFTVDDLMTFKSDMTFSLTQAYWVGVDGVVAMNACQKGTGTYSYTEDTLTITFDSTSDPGMNSDTPSYAFSDLYQTVSIQPTAMDFPLVFTRLD